MLRAWRPLFAAAIHDKAEGERVLRASALEWVIVRPVVSLSFADCAACLLHALSESAWTRQIVNLGRS